jgi:hypothetical protein
MQFYNKEGSLDTLEVSSRKPIPRKQKEANFKCALVNIAIKNPSSGPKSSLPKLRPFAYDS